MLYFATKGNVKVGIVEGYDENLSAIYGSIAIAFTMAICFLVGLPIRIIPGVYSWWVRKPVINALVFIVGLLLIVLPSYYYFNVEIFSATPRASELVRPGNVYFVLTGWFLLAFSLLHFYPSKLLALKNT